MHGHGISIYLFKNLNFLFYFILGIYYYVDGDKYDGEWKNSKQQGKGNEINSNE